MLSGLWIKKVLQLRSKVFFFLENIMKRQDFLLKLGSTLPLILSIYVNMFKMKYAIIGVIFFKNCFVSPVSLQSSTTYFKLFGKGKSYLSFH